jgi:DNA-binding NtrC family response regulator
LHEWRLCNKTGKRIAGFTEESLEALLSYEWPGNVRQLRNFIEHLLIMADQHIPDMLDLLENLNLNTPGKIPFQRQDR